MPARIPNPFPGSGQEDPIESFVPEPGDDEETEITRSFQKLKTNVEQYVELPQGHGYHYDGSPSSWESVGTIKRPEIPMMISVDPPIRFPSGEYRSNKKEIPAPQTVEMKLTTLSRPGNRTGFKLEPKNGEDATIETEISKEETRNYSAYLSNLRERYETFKRQSRRSKKIIEDKNTQEVLDRAEERDKVLENHRKAIKKGRKPQANEEYIRQQALLLQRIDPMFMYINPESFDRSYSHMVSDGDFVRDGVIVEHFQQEQPTISASGKIGAYYVHKQGKKDGLTRSLRRSSAAYKRFMELMMVYRNNGYLYNVDKRISLIGGIKLFYDGTAYIGSFDDFSVSESEDQPYTLEYDFSFTVRHEIDIKEFNFTESNALPSDVDKDDSVSLSFNTDDTS